MTAKQTSGLQAPDGSYFVTLTDGNGTLAPASSSGETSTNLTQVGGVTVALGQTTKSASIPVTIASDQGATAVTGTFYQATQPVSLATAPTTPVTGTFWQTTQPVSITDGPTTSTRLLSAVGTSQDSTLVKNAAGNLFTIIGTNVATSARYLKFYNKASAPTVGTDTPIMTFYLPPSSSFAFDLPLGYLFATGLGFGLTTAAADNSVAGVTAGDIICLNVLYT